MAYVQKPDNTDPNAPATDGSQQSGSLQGANGGVSVSGSSDSGSNGSSGTSKDGLPQYAPAPTKSGSFNNIQNYLDANSGYNNGQGLAGKAYNTLKDQQQKQESAIGGAANQFQQDTTQAGYGQGGTYDPSKVSNFVQQATADPTKFAGDDANVKQYQQYLGAQYNGPQGLNNAGDMQSQANQFAQTTGLTTSEPGRAALLQKLYDNGSYSQGQQSLDGLLMGSDPNQLAHLQAAQGLGGQLQSDFAKAQGNAQQQAQQYGQWANQDASSSGTALTKAATTTDQTLQDKAAQAVKDQQSAYGRINNELQAGSISSADLASLGLKPEDVQNLYGLSNNNLTGLLSQAPAATKQSVAGQGDVDQLNALAKLGGSYLPNVGTIAQQYNDPNSIGSYKGPVQFDSNALLGQINNQKALYQGEFDPAQKALTDSQSTTQARTDLLNQYKADRQSIQSNPLGANQNYNDLIPQLQKLYGSDVWLNAAIAGVAGPGRSLNDLLSGGYLDRGVSGQLDQQQAKQTALDNISAKYGGGKGLRVT